jgi:hypothetical protein
VHQSKQGKRNCQAQPHDIDERKKFILPEIPNGDFEIVFYHSCMGISKTMEKAEECFPMPLLMLFSYDERMSLYAYFFCHDFSVE